MAKIVTITNPLTGQPAQVDQLDHTAQQIDDGLNIARNVSNPNLLDNWYFGNPINQRGQTSYTGDGYGIDRWMTTNSSVIIADGMIQQKGSGQIYQRIENLNSLIGRKLTFSALLSDHSLLTGSWTFDDKNIDVATADDIVLAYNTDYQFMIYARTNSTRGIIAAKLELGSQQTLAHQENGVWVLNDLPNYADTLARCQSHQLIFDAGYEPIGIGQATASNIVEIYVPTPVTFRKIPVASGGLYLRNGGGFIAASGVNVEAMSPNSVRLAVTANVTAGMAYEAFTTGNDKFILDANL